MRQSNVSVWYVKSKSSRNSGFQAHIRWSSWSHTCSMMFMSGDKGGQGRTVTLLFWNQSLATCNVCFGSLSCWKITLPSPIFFNFWSLRVPRRLCWRISTSTSMFDCFLCETRVQGLSRLHPAILAPIWLEEHEFWLIWENDLFPDSTVQPACAAAHAEALGLIDWGNPHEMSPYWCSAQDTVMWETHPLSSFGYYAILWTLDHWIIDSIVSTALRLMLSISRFCKALT